MKELAERIYCFIEKYAAISPNWDEESGDDKYTSPDAYQMIMCANELSSGNKPTRCFSEWGSGGYKPYSSKEGKEEHDYLVSEIYKIINEKTKIVNNKTEFGNYLIEVYGWYGVRSGLESLICRAAEEDCSMMESTRRGCEDYYEAELQGNQEQGYVKFNIPLEEMIDVLEDIARQ